MSVAYQIENVPLKESMDFRVLKARALKIIQEQSGQEWTNYNPADPGITILDQLCYALTELGYCTDFPIEDVLTPESGQINFDGQFFKAPQVLTSAPLTRNDFKRLLVSNIEGIKNLEIATVPAKLSPVYGIYQSYLAFDHNTNIDAQQLCRNAFLFLNQFRTLGAFFTMPQPLKKKRYYLHATLSIDSLKHLSALFLQLNYQLAEWVFPCLQPTGYQQLIDEGFTTDQIINGPKLKNGWIPDEEISNKKNTVKLIDLFNVLVDNPQVLNAEHLELEEAEKEGFIEHKATSKADELICFDLKDDLLNNRILLKVKGSELITEEERQQYLNELNKDAVLKVASKTVEVDLSSSPGLPKGNYREIEDYYSIQNTFPEVFAVGENAQTKNSTAYQKGLSRQLGAYLTFFDQSLGNQFSQLANVDKLLSFKNYLSADERDSKSYQHLKKQEKYNPAPYQKFAPTYFYQSLYHIPNIRPLLKDSEAFEFFDEVDSITENEEKAWKNYQNSPYNAYIHGLMDLIESPSTAYKRRNQALDHLLARHGQSPALIDALIEGSFYTGEKTRDKIIFKSLYLQNFALLNYHKQSAGDFLGAKRLHTYKGGLNKGVLQLLQSETDSDFIFQAEKIDALESISEKDFRDFSGIQLKFNLLFGLRNCYRNFILEQWNPLFKVKPGKGRITKRMQQAYWFMQQKGCILIETSLLAMLAHYEVVFSTTTEDGKRYFRIGQFISYSELLLLEESLEDPEEIEHFLKKDTVAIGEQRYELNELDADEVADLEFSLINEFEELSISFIADWGQSTASMNHAFLQNKLLLILPDFIERFAEAAFLQRLELLMGDNLPLHMDYEVFQASSAQLEKFVPTYVNWRNGLRHAEDLNTKERLEQSVSTQGFTDDLISQLSEFQHLNSTGDA